MKKLLKTILPVLLILLVLALLFGPGPAETPAPTAQPTGAGGLQLLEEPANETPQPGLSLLPEEPSPAPEPTAEPETEETSPAVEEDGVYTSMEDVALYVHLYGHLPSNFITKKQAQALGWEGGSLEPYAPGKSIGGDWFGNYEGLLPKAKGRSWTECDIDTMGARSRGAKRLIFSNDGLIYYTDDHYESFTLLYGDP